MNRPVGSLGFAVVGASHHGSNDAFEVSLEHKDNTVDLFNVVLQGIHNLHDQFDLRPTAGRTGAYNIACQVLGTMYHDVLGGNDKITIEAKWQIKK